MLWQPGQLNNQQIIEKFGLTYSAVSRRVGVFKDFLRKNSGLQNKLNRVKALIKIWHLSSCIWTQLIPQGPYHVLATVSLKITIA